MSDNPIFPSFVQCVNCEKEVAERWKLGTDGAETNPEVPVWPKA